ncbi:MAG: hypothetical protein ACXACC_09970 [Promethearchaeota archaeon]|jgi:hypothetical protein
MTEAYANFMVFELEDTGERQQLEMTEQEFRHNNGNGVLHPYQVAIIVKEDLRRIYIWKGFTSSVRKKFIASRVASELQQELVTNAGFHRCKVISVDQGDEPHEFLNAFGFEKQHIQEVGEIEQPEVKDGLNSKIHETHKKYPIKHTNNSKSFVSKSFKQVKSEKKSREIFEKIIQNEVPKNYKRKNVLTGQNILYGEIFKKANIFGETIEEREWQPVTNLPKEIFELEGHKLRIYFNNEIGMIEAIEVLETSEEVLEPKKEDKEEGKIDYNRWTVKQLKEFCKKNDISVPSSYRKADVVHLVKEFTKTE